MNIVVIEDEAITAMFLQEILEDLGHNVCGTFDNGDAFFKFLTDSPKIDLVLTDIQINGRRDGIDIAYEISIMHPGISIVFITSFKDSQTIKDSQKALPVGYLIKPVIVSDIEAVLMVVESAQKIKSISTTSIIHFGEYSYNRETKALSKNSKLIHLSTNETVFIYTLVKNLKSYVSHEELMLNIWSEDTDRSVSLRELVYRLRKKLPDLKIENVSKMGYSLGY